MPVRIYDIAKKLGIENKEVLAKAKELGIAAARVPSSSLDKITAEFLESHLGPPRVATPPPAPIAPEPIVLVKAPEPPPPEPVPEPVEAVAPPAPAEIANGVSTVEHAPAPVVHAEASAPVTAEAPAAIPQPEPEAKIEPPPPPLPAAPRIGEKVGFIQLPVKPAPRTPDKQGGAQQQRPGA